MKQIYDVIIIGGGASGLFLASLLSKKELSVLVLEQNKIVGKKLALTGNGRCNYTNLYQSETCYRSGDILKAYSIIQEFNAEKIIAHFKKLGIIPDIKKGRSFYHEEAGYVYPYSGSGKDFVQVLYETCVSSNIKIKTNTKVYDLKKIKDCFEVITGENGYSYYSKNLVIACGGLALPSSGSDGNLRKIVMKFGHKFKEEVPALTFLKTKSKEVSSLSGLRIQAGISLFSDDNLVYKEIGELQFSDRGISGIPAMQISGLAAGLLREGKKLSCELDFFPFSDEVETDLILRDRKKDLEGRKFTSFFAGMFPEKLSLVLLKPFLDADSSRSELKEDDLLLLVKRIKKFKVSIDGTGDFSTAQTTSGGLILSELNEDLSSKFVDSLYFVGEVLDVDGLCGGYNLTWAWASAFKVAKKIGE